MKPSLIPFLFLLPLVLPKYGQAADVQIELRSDAVITQSNDIELSDVAIIYTESQRLRVAFGETRVGSIVSEDEAVELSAARIACFATTMENGRKQPA